MRCLGKGCDRVAVWGTLYMFARGCVPLICPCVKACEGLGSCSKKRDQVAQQAPSSQNGRGGKGVEISTRARQISLQSWGSALPPYVGAILASTQPDGPAALVEAGSGQGSDDGGAAGGF